jgi:hypothetical protein
LRWRLTRHSEIALFWDITQRRLVILYRSFGTNYRSHLQGSGSPRRTQISCTSRRKPEITHNTTFCFRLNVILAFDKLSLKVLLLFLCVSQN